MPNDLLKTSQVTALLHIPMDSLQEYVKRFRQFLSIEASKPARGRRFNQEDLQRLATIRQMSLARKSTAEIITALNEPAPMKPQGFDPLTLLQFIQDAQKQIALDVKTVQHDRREIENVKQDYQRIKRDFRLLKTEHEILKMELLRIKLLWAHPPIYQKRKTENRPWDGIWKQFRNWVWESIDNDLNQEPDPITLQYSKIRYARRQYLPEWRAYKDKFDPDEFEVGDDPFRDSR